MNDNPSRDSELQAFEAQLATLRPRISRDQTNQLLYACAFAAGESSAKTALTRWRVAAGLLCVLTLGFAATAWQRPESVVHQSVEPPQQTATIKELQSVPAESLTQKPKEVNLDAWSVAPDRTPFGQRFAQAAYDDPHLRSLTVAAMTRAALHE